MPYPNEHSCRMTNPEKYDKIRRENNKGKVPDMIFGIKAGKSEVQAYRFPIDRFSAADAKAFCTEHEGSFEKAEEAKESIDKKELKDVHEILLKEVGKRNAAKDEERIRKIMDLCKELLTSVDASQEKVEEAIKECKEVVKSLKSETLEDIKEDAEFSVEEVTEDLICKGILPIRIISQGFNSSKNRYYSPAAINSCANAFEGCKMFVNHSDASNVRDVRDWVATLRDVKASEKGNAVGNAYIHSKWLKEIVKELHGQNNLSQLGVSINATGVGAKDTIEGMKTIHIKEIKKTPIGSVDFVTFPGAGGQAGLLESMEVTDNEKRRLKMELEEEVASLKTEVVTLTEERDSLKTKIETIEKDKRVFETQVAIKEQVSKSDLPDIAKENILKKFEMAETVDGVDEAIQKESEYIAKIKEAGKPRDLGKTNINSEDGRKKLKESFLKMGLTEAQAEVASKGR